MKENNTKKIKPERMAQLKAIQKELARTQELLQDVISGNITMGKMAKALGYREEYCSTLIADHLAPYFRKMNFLTPKEALEVLLDTASPYERIAGDLFLGENDRCPKDRLFIMTHAEEEAMADAIENTLSDQEKKVLSLRYGLCGEYPDGLTYRKIAALQNCSPERARQIGAMALRKLKCPRLYHAMFPDYWNHMSTLQDLDSSIGDMGIEYLGLSTRVYNILKKHGCNTIKSITQLTADDLEQMHGIGDACEQEIVDTLTEYGLSLRKKVWKRRPVTDVLPEMGS